MRSRARAASGATDYATRYTPTHSSHMAPLHRHHSTPPETADRPPGLGAEGQEGEHLGEVEDDAHQLRQQCGARPRALQGGQGDEGPAKAPERHLPVSHLESNEIDDVDAGSALPTGPSLSASLCPLSSWRCVRSLGRSRTKRTGDQKREVAPGPGTYAAKSSFSRAQSKAPEDLQVSSGASLFAPPIQQISPRLSRATDDLHFTTQFSNPRARTQAYARNTLRPRTAVHAAASTQLPPDVCVCFYAVPWQATFRCSCHRR